MKYKTTVGRFWGYVGIALALTISLAGNVESARLHTPDVDPTWVEIAFAGLPPLVAFLSIEIVNHNPWKNAGWGIWVTRVLLWVVAPGSALVSFVHLTLVGLHSLQVPVPADLQTILNVATAILTALLIDGLVFGGTAALLLPPVQVPDVPLVLTRVPDWRAEMRAEMERALEALKRPDEPKPVHQVAKPVKAPEKPARPRSDAPAKPGQKRFPARLHPLWDDWVLAHGSEPWTPERLVQETKDRMGEDLSVPAAAIKITRWEKALAEDQDALTTH